MKTFKDLLNEGESNISESFSMESAKSKLDKVLKQVLVTKNFPIYEDIEFKSYVKIIVFG